MNHSYQNRVVDIAVVECLRLKNTGWIGKQDSYVCFQYGSTRFKTRTCSGGGTSPVFEGNFTLPLIKGLREIDVEVWNRHRLSRDNLIGSGRVQLQNVLSGGYEERCWTILTTSGRFAGEVKLIMKYSQPAMGAGCHLPFTKNKISNMNPSYQNRVVDITVVECLRLKDTEWFTKQDPYVLLQYGSAIFKTRTCSGGGTAPVFQANFTLPLIEGLREIDVGVWNRHRLSRDNLIGSGRVQLQNVILGGYEERCWTIFTRSERRYAGEVKLIMRYSQPAADNPPPHPTTAYPPPPPFGPSTMAYPPPNGPSKVAYPPPNGPPNAAYPPPPSSAPPHLW